MGKGHSWRPFPTGAAEQRVFVFFCNGVCFALRSGEEHRRLRFKECQIQVVEKPGERAYLAYTEDFSKNHQGGLKGRKLKTKEVIHHKNTAVPSRCPVQLHKLYRSLCPQDCPGSAFYLKPLKKPKQDCWFTAVPLGHNTLNNMMKTMCKAAGITGHKTNHSLRATTATRLFHAGVDEQLIMEHTGHGASMVYAVTSEPAKSSKGYCLTLSILPFQKKKPLHGHSSEVVACNQNTLQAGLAPGQITLQSCCNIAFNISYGQV